MNDIIKSVKRFLYDHELEDAAMLLCNLMLECVEGCDEDFAMEVISAVLGNERFDLEGIDNDST